MQWYIDVDPKNFPTLLNLGIPRIRDTYVAKVAAAPPRRPDVRQLLLVSLWLVTATSGFFFVLRYETSPGTLAAPPKTWPEGAFARPASGTYSLVMAVHPHCPCSRASIAELSSIMSHSGNLHAYVLFLSPRKVASNWERTDLWASAQSIPRTTAIADKDGALLALFNCKTSGQTLLYDAAGNLKFNGGITSARGHQGDNAGRDAILAFARTGIARHAETLVFGCGLKDNCKNGK